MLEEKTQPAYRPRPEVIAVCDEDCTFLVRGIIHTGAEVMFCPECRKCWTVQ
jgi:hypothetical protein